jgi:diguanylate cyclase (GGDEF)-like protein
MATIEIHAPRTERRHDVKFYYEKADCDRIAALARRRGNAGAHIALAWSIRQRDPEQCLLAIERAESLLAGLNDRRACAVQARAAVMRAELTWLRGRIDDARTLLAIAEASFEACADHVGLGDTQLLKSRLAYDDGDRVQGTRALELARLAYQQGGDSGRTAVVDAWKAVDASFHVEEWLLAAIAERQVRPAIDAGTAVAGLWLFVEAQLAFSQGNYAAASATFESASRKLSDGGLVRQCISAAINGGAALGNLNDFDGQTVVVEKALALADQCGWPYSSASCCYSLGDVYQALGRLDEAKAAFKRAAAHAACAPRSRLSVAVHSFLGEICRRTGDTAGAHAALTSALQAADAGGHSTLRPRILVGLADSESAAGRPQEAIRIASEALDACRSNDLVTERLALLALTRIHLKHPASPDEVARSPALRCMDRLWARLAESRDWEPDDEVLSMFAQACEQAGDLPGALHYERWRVRLLGTATVQRAHEQTTAMQARHEARVAKLELDHHRAMNAVEANRLDTVERLAVAGREITQSLDFAHVFASISGHARALLAADGLCIWLLQGAELVPAFISDEGRSVTGRVVALDDPVSNCARAARLRAEILIEREDDEIGDRHIPGTRPSRSALFAPLETPGQVLGVLSVQSISPRAYGELERHVFRNLVSYCAVAINNAVNFRAVQTTNERMAQAQAQLEAAAWQDELTGVANRRHLMQWSAAALAKHQAMGVLLLDIDHFKLVNDRHGHATGDEALRAVAKVLRNSTRPGDTVGRYGGEEFAMLLPRTDLASAVTIAERVRANIAAASIEHEGLRFTLTASIGVASVMPGELALDAALDRADRALYRAKSGGRNRVEAFDGATPTGSSNPAAGSH